MKKGFTLIELVIVIVILGILAAVAVPKFADLTVKAKEAACKGALGGLRSAISIRYAENLANGVATASAWPNTSEVVGLMTQPVANPYNTLTNVIAGGVAGRTVTGAAGFRYDLSTGLIYPDTSSSGENAW